MSKSAVDFPRDNVRLALNRIIARGTLASSQIERAIGVSIDMVIPHETEIVRRAINMGEPFVLTSPGCEATRVNQDFAYSIGAPLVLPETEMTLVAKAVRTRVKVRPS